LDWLEKLGPKACLLAWLPAVGDPLCAVAGWLKLPFWPCLGLYGNWQVCALCDDDGGVDRAGQDLVSWPWLIKMPLRELFFSFKKRAPKWAHRNAQGE
jgi:hypothetical protein